MSCKARQYSDQMNCKDCGLVWDVNDPEPPACNKKARRMTNNAAKALALIQADSNAHELRPARHNDMPPVHAKYGMYKQSVAIEAYKALHEDAENRATHYIAKDYSPCMVSLARFRAGEMPYIPVTIENQPPTARLLQHGGSVAVIAEGRELRLHPNALIVWLPKIEGTQ